MMAGHPADRGSPPASRGPFSRPMSVRGIPASGRSRSIAATLAECSAVAADLKFFAIASLSADLRVVPRGGGFEVSGCVEALMTQVCVVTLEPFESLVRQEVAVDFSFPPPIGSPRARAASTSRSASTVPISSTTI